MSIQHANRLRWDGSSAPFYEAYPLKIMDPDGQWALWLEYQLVIYAEGSAPVAKVLAVYQEPDRAPVMVQKQIPMADIDIFHEDYFIQLGQDYLALDSAYGDLADQHHSINWDLQFEDPTRDLTLYPYSYFYSSTYPRLKFLSPRHASFVSGSFEVNDKKIRLDHVPCYQSHVWGTGLFSQWLWGHCSLFNQDSSASFEGLSLPVVGSSVGLFCFVWENQLYRGNGISHWLLNRSRSNILEWSFEARFRHLQFKGVIKRDFPQIIGFCYNGPNGEKRFCHHTDRGSMQLAVFQKKDRNWQRAALLTAENSASFQSVMRQPDSRVRF